MRSVSPPSSLSRPHLPTLPTQVDFGRSVQTGRRVLSSHTGGMDIAHSPSTFLRDEQAPDLVPYLYAADARLKRARVMN